MKKQHGFSIVEMMIAMLLGIILIGGMIQIMVGNKGSYSMQEALSQMQESARFAIERISNQGRAAGYYGCTSEIQKTSVLSSTTSPFADFYNGITGFEGGKDTFPTIINGAKTDTDALIIHSIAVDSPMIVDSHISSNTAFTVSSAHALNPVATNRPILLAIDANCRQTSLFAMTGPANASGTATTVLHEQTGSGSPQNCTRALRGTHTDCSGTPPASAGSNFPSGSRVYALDSAVYYIDDLTRGTNNSALFYRPANGTAQELVEGIEDMSIRYGVDSDSDGVPNQFVKANDINKTGSTFKWSDVISVRIALLLRSQNKLVDGSQSYKFDGATQTSTDGHVRQEYTATVMLRNRG